MFVQRKVDNIHGGDLEDAGTENLLAHRLTRLMPLIQLVASVLRWLDGGIVLLHMD